MRRLSLEEVKSTPVISRGHFDNLIWDDGEYRVWHSRMTVLDGMSYDNQITVEKCNSSLGRWEIVERYEAK